jgi:hypothetical protein
VDESGREFDAALDRIFHAPGHAAHARKSRKKSLS